MKKSLKNKEVIPPNSPAKLPKINKFKISLKVAFWFLSGALIGLFLAVFVVYAVFLKVYENHIYPGIYVNGINFSGKTPSEVSNYFATKNKNIWKNTFTINAQDQVATVSAKDLNLGYDSDTISQQAYSIGRSPDSLANLSTIFQSYIQGSTINSYRPYDDQKIHKFLAPIEKAEYIAPVNAVFTFENGRASAFEPSSDGQTIDEQSIKDQILQKIPTIEQGTESKNYQIMVKLKVLKPAVTTDKVNNLGITSLIGQGESQFAGSIDSRIYNIELASSRINGALVAPGQIFSFDQTLGDVSSFTGYKQAYVIENGQTVLGDGGGVCQVSTTVFRAILNSGMPIIERHAHAYRVGYYEEDSPPGLDATIYVPSVDLKFKNDTAHYILIQAVVDPVNLKLTVSFYGTPDGRISYVSTPVITSQTPAPPAKTIDDPTLPAGTIKQTDFSANGASVYFTRKVVKNGNVLINETFYSNYQPWQAVYLHGTG